MTTPFQKQTVLVVDDHADNIALLSNILTDQYKVKAALSGSKAIEIARFTQPDLILLDVMMPEMNGYEVCRVLKDDPRTKNIPVIFITALGKEDDEKIGFDSGAVDYITKPVKPPIVLARVKTHLSLYDQNRTLERMVLKRTEELANSRREILYRLGRAAEFRDNETGMHVERMSHYSRIIAEATGMSRAESEIIFNAAPMHDVGKIGIPDNILLKPDKLTKAEFLIMQRHAEFGAHIIGKHDDPLLYSAALVALSHHEKWDGSGYPRNLAGEDIPLIGRITAIADVFDALTSTRPYKKAWKAEDAVDYIRQGRGTHFDPWLTELFEARLTEILDIHHSLTDKDGERE